VGAVGEDDHRAAQEKEVGLDHLIRRDGSESRGLVGQGGKGKCRKGQGQDGKERTTGKTLHRLDIGAKAEKPKRGERREWRE